MNLKNIINQIRLFRIVNFTFLRQKRASIRPSEIKTFVSRNKRRTQQSCYVLGKNRSVYENQNNIRQS